MASANSPYYLEEDGTSSGSRVLNDLTDSELEDFATSPVLDEDEEEDTGPEVQQTAPAVPVPSFMMLNKDVRVMIYELLLKSDTPTIKPSYVEVRSSDFRRNGRIMIPKWSSNCSGFSLAICRTSRIIAAESLKFLYGHNTFEFDGLVTAWEFSQKIGSNNIVLVNKAIMTITADHHHFRTGVCPGEDSILEGMILNSLNFAGSEHYPCLKKLSYSFSHGDSISCPAFRSALTAMDGDVVIALLNTGLHSLETLQMDGFPPETVDYILKFLRSGQKYVAPSADLQPPGHITPLRSLPLHTCLSCENCKCAQGIKPAQLLKIQEPLKLLQSQLASGATKPDEATRKLLERFANAFL